MPKISSRPWARVRAVALALALAAGGTAATAAPAQADVSIQNIAACSISPPHYFCKTAIVTAHPDHWIKVMVWPPRIGLVECSLYDAANHIRVGYVSRSANSASPTTQTVRGLYAAYYLQCVNFQGYGSGQISN
jgi:hypothetical protein